MKSVKFIFAAILLLDCLSAMGLSQKPPGQNAAGQTQSNEALKFLGSYSAPSAIAATETGHVSAHPPSPPAGQRLKRVETGPTLLPPWPLDLAWSTAELSAACGGSNFSSKIQPAQQALEIQSYPQAAKLYDEMARGGERCLPFSWNLALARAYGRRPTALDELATALPHAPSPAAGHLAMGLVRLAVKDATVSGADFDGLEPAGVRARDALWAKALLAWSSGQLPEARELLLRLTSLEPNTPAVWFALGGVALDQARDSSRRLAESAPEGSWNRRLESEALQFRYPDLARSVLPKEAMPVEEKPGRPNENEMQTAAAGSNAGSDHPELELRRLESIADSPPTLYLRVRAALRLSELAYLRASHSPTFNGYLCAIRAFAAEEESDEPAAESEYRAGLAENPDSALLHAGLGHLFRRQWRLDAARNELGEAVALDSTDPVAAFELGDVFQRQGDQAHASELLSRAIEIDPGLLVARWSRAKAYLALGDDQQALSDLEAAAPADNSGELQWQLARLYRKIGRDDLAEKAEKRSEQQRQQLKRINSGGKP